MPIHKRNFHKREKKPIKDVNHELPDISTLINAAELTATSNVRHKNSIYHDIHVARKMKLCCRVDSSLCMSGGMAI